MKTLTLHQPWATALAHGIKTVETRGWRTDYRGPLAIDAGAKQPSPGEVYGEWRVFANASGIGRSRWVIEHIDATEHDLPLGAIVATCRLVDVVPIVARANDPANGNPPYLICDGHLWRNGQHHPGHPLDGREQEWNIEAQLAWGDYTPGRWAWLLDDVKPTTERCPACMNRGFTAERPITTAVRCQVCHGDDGCEPVPARGRQGLWEWTP